MGVLTIEGVIDEHGQIQLVTNVQLPKKTKVYIVIPNLESDVFVKEKVYIYSPRLVHPEQVAEFELEVIGEVADASV